MHDLLKQVKGVVTMDGAEFAMSNDSQDTYEITCLKADVISEGGQYNLVDRHGGLDVFRLA